MKYKNTYKKYTDAYKELINNLTEYSHQQLIKNPTVFYMTFITFCEKYETAKKFDFNNFDNERAYEFKQLIKDPIKNFNYVFGNECFVFFKKITVEKIIKILESEVENEI